MIKGILFLFNVILIIMFLTGVWYGAKKEQKDVELFSGFVALIMALNSLFILNS